MSSVLTKTPALSRMTLAVPVSEAAAAFRASQMTAHRIPIRTLLFVHQRSTDWGTTDRAITFVAPIVWLSVPVFLTLGLQTWAGGGQ